MGKVVKLEPTAKGKGAAAKRRARMAARGVGRQTSVDRRRRPRPDKTALVLGGGGFTGGVYEIGALRALDLLTLNSTVTQFDVYVGTSAGAFIAALCANGVTPEEMMSVVTQQGHQPFKDVNLSDLLHLNVREFVRKGAVMPIRAAGLAKQMFSQRGSVSLMDVMLGRTDDFRELPCELYITATDLDTCERVVFGVDSAEIPISKAVRASGALPMVYAPVRVEDRELIDGGIVSTTNLDIAVQAGAKLIVVINPIVPFVNDFTSTVRTLGGTRPRRVSDMGFPQIGYQVFKLVAHQRLHELAKGWERRYPGVDIVLIEPDPTDELMFQTSMMNFTSRVEIARHGFESVTKHLAGEYARYREIADRHGIEISGARVRKVVEHFDTEREHVSAWRKILEGTTGALLRQAGSSS